MMDWMRYRAKYVIWFVVVVFVVSIFYVWGAGGKLSGDETVIAKVQGATITAGDIDLLVRQYQEKNPTADLPQLKQYAFQQLVNRKLLEDASQRMNIKISDDLLKERLVKDYFQSDLNMRQALNNPQVPWRAMEEEVTHKAALDKVQERIRNGVRVTESEIQQAFLEDKELRDVKWMAIEIHPSSLEEETAKQKAEGLLKRVKDGEDFAALARANSDDAGTKDKGGDLGFFKKGQMIPEFDKVIFQLKAGEVGPLVKTKYGYHVIKVEAIRKEDATVNARHMLVVLRPGPDTLKMLKDKAESLFQGLSLNQDFDQIAKQATKSGTIKSVTRQTTALGKYTSAAPAIEQAFLLKVGQVSTPIQTEEAFFLVKPTSKKSPDLKDLPPLKKTYLEKALAKKSNDIFQMWFYNLYQHGNVKVINPKG